MIRPVLMIILFLVRISGGSKFPYSILIVYFSNLIIILLNITGILQMT